MSRTTAGRALLADPTMLTDDGEEAAEEAIDAIEREAAQQERERIRAALASRNLDAVDKATVAAILADSSPSASAEPDGEPSE